MRWQKKKRYIDRQNIRKGSSRISVGNNAMTWCNMYVEKEKARNIVRQPPIRTENESTPESYASHAFESNLSNTFRH